MSQARIVDHVLDQVTASRRVTHPDDVAYWRRVIDEVTGHVLGYVAEHPLPERWVDAGGRDE